MHSTKPSLVLLIVLLSACTVRSDPAAFRKSGQPVEPVSDTTIIAEAEEFYVGKPGGWKAKAWGENYFTATFANAFLSRKAFLGAPEQCDEAVATIEVRVPKAGRYLVLARYESVY